MALIGVVDCNNFFVSCERLFRPDLQNQPVAVLSSNDGCFVARSQEVKDMDIPMGVPYFKVKDIVKDNKVILFSSHFTLYRDVSRRVFATLRERLDEVEQYSIDEAFFAVPKADNPQVLATEIKSMIETNVGVPVSVGIASSKTKAKYAVELAKKTTGVHVLSQSDWQARQSEITLSALWGVGGRSFLRYKKAGYQTVADLLQGDPARINTLFGVAGERLQAEVGTAQAYQVEQKLTDQQSMVSSRTFRSPTSSKFVVEDAIAYHTRQIAKDLRQQNLSAQVVRISIRASKYSDFLLQGASLEAVLDTPTNDTFTLLTVTQKLLQQAFRGGVPYKKVGVSVGHLVSKSLEQESLFLPEQTERASLMELIDTLNTKADREVITIGERKQAEQWQAKKERISPAYTTKWTDVAVAKA